jgi:hypothetical protein
MDSHVCDSCVILEPLVSPSVSIVQFVSRWFSGPSVQGIQIRLSIGRFSVFTFQDVHLTSVWEFKWQTVTSLAASSICMSLSFGDAPFSSHGIRKTT